MERKTANNTQLNHLVAMADLRCKVPVIRVPLQGLWGVIHSTINHNGTIMQQQRLAIGRTRFHFVVLISFIVSNCFDFTLKELTQIKDLQIISMK